MGKIRIMGSISISVRFITWLSIGFDLFRLKKLNERNFNDTVLNLISKQ